MRYTNSLLILIIFSIWEPQDDNFDSKKGPYASAFDSGRPVIASEAKQSPGWNREIATPFGLAMTQTLFKHRSIKDLQRKIDRATATSFEKKVWKTLLKIPKGQVRSYGWVAKQVGVPHAVRAVGNAVNKNPFAPEVPCHRVIRSDGSLGGYAKGLKAKRALLRKEGFFDDRSNKFWRLLWTLCFPIWFR